MIGKQDKYDPPLRFQRRDGQILEAIHGFDGVLARRQVKSLFWPRASQQAMERRLSLMKRSGYIDWPDTAQRRTKPIPEPIVWLGWRGALYVAGKAGAAIDPPNMPNETQLRELHQALRDHGIRWLREPRWIQLGHDLTVVDIRLAFERAAAAIPALALDEWIPEGAFLGKMDQVRAKIKGRDGSVRTEKRGVRPDGFFVIADATRMGKDGPHRSRNLLELDLATHPIGRFTERAALYLDYIFSPAYKARFGYNSGRWLVITRSAARRDHLREHTKESLNTRASFFWFSTLKEVLQGNPLTDPIWIRGDWTHPGTLLVGHSPSVVYDATRDASTLTRR